MHIPDSDDATFPHLRDSSEDVRRSVTVGTQVIDGLEHAELADGALMVA